MNSKKLIYIVGYPRSGSTIIQNILNEYPGAFAVGEIKTILSYNIKKQKPCSCGMTISECDKWGPVFRYLTKEYSLEKIIEIDQLRTSIANKNFTKVRYSSPKRIINKNEEYVFFLRKLYGKIFEDHQIIIDSSKDPMYGWLLGEILDVEVYFLHLIRDPRACHYSFKKNNIDTFNLRWMFLNFNAEYLKRYNYLRVYYEKFTRSPDFQIDRVLKTCGLNPNYNPVKKNMVNLRGNHALAGNPNRFETGLTQINSSGNWKNKLSYSEKLKLRITSEPLFSFYGYK